MALEATLVRIQQETPTVKSFLFDLGGGEMEFKPGQWVDLYVDTGPSVEAGGYSITSTPLQRGSFELAIKKLPWGAPAIYLHERAREGEVFTVRGGSGDFCLDPDWSGPMVFVAGGIGITPVISMLRYLDQTRMDQDVRLLYSAGSPSELAFRDEIERMSERNPGFNAIFTVTRPHEELWNGRTGRIGRSLLLDQRPAGESLYYLCGPPQLQDDLSSVLSEIGVSGSHVKSERWW